MAVGLAGDAVGATGSLLTATAKESQATFHRHAARRMLRVFGEMKGLPLKAGQVLSYIDELLPEEHRHIYNEMLGNLQMHTPPMDWEDVERVFKEEFEGQGPLEVFGAFEHEPIAAASIGQVYHAHTKDGDEVAVKIQYPGVAEAIHSDLQNVDTLMSTMSAVIPKADFKHFMDDALSRIEEECDYTIESQNQRDFERAWAGDPWVVIPKTYEALSTRRVLTSEFLHAHEWKEMLQVAPEDLRKRYSGTLFRFVFTSLFQHGMFNGDPHPGNYLFYPDGRVAFIDYGCVQRYSDEQTQAFRDLREGVLSGARGEAFHEIVRRVFSLPADMDEEMVSFFENYLHLSFEPATAAQPYRFTRAYTKEILNKMMDLKLLLAKKMLSRKNVNFWESEDAGIAFLGRINFGLGSILTSLDSEVDYRGILEGIETG